MTDAPHPGADAREESAFDRRAITRRIALFVVIAVVVGALFAILPGVGEVRARLREAQPRWIAVAAALELASVLSFVVALLGAFDRIVPFRRGLMLGLAEQGANVLLPAGGTGGPALGTFVMRRAGVPPQVASERHVALFLITSAVGFVALALFGVLEAIGLLPGDSALAGTLLPAGVGVLVLLGVAALARGQERPEPEADRRARHTVWRLRGFLRGGVRTSLRLLREHDAFLLGGAIGYYAFDVAAVAAAFEAFGGGGPPLGVFVLAYTIGHAGAFIPTPGGIGGTDGGLIGMFAAYGAPLGLATAAVLSYRVFQLGFPALLGAVGLVSIQRTQPDAQRRAEIAERFAPLELAAERARVAAQ